jgi:hypothetical protein
MAEEVDGEDSGDVADGSAVWLRDGRIGKLFGPWGSERLEAEAREVVSPVR